MALHDAPVGSTDEWYTPPQIFGALGCSFDLDVASPGREIVWWIPAADHLTSGGLDAPWRGFVWMNPPFGGRNGIAPWLDRFVSHGNGVAFFPDRTSAPWWQKYAPRMDRILFVSPKIRMVNARGEVGPSPPDGTCLGAIGKRGVEAVRRAACAGLGFLMRADDFS